MDQATVNSILATFGVLSGSVATIIGAVLLSRSAKAKQALEAAELEAKNKIEAAKMEADDAIAFRRDLLALQERLQGTVERQQKELELKDEKMEAVRQRGHELNRIAQEGYNELQREVLNLTKKFGELEKNHEKEIGDLKVAHEREAADCREQLTALRTRIALLEPPCLPGESDPRAVIPVGGG